jgi:3D (Asp-Asp-Asp) domain-containing protein
MREANYVTVHDAAVTSTTPDSVVPVRVTENTLSWEIADNLYGDKLPVIPTDARVEHGKVQYRHKIIATLRRRDGTPLAGRSIHVASNRGDDSVRASGPSSDNGEVSITLETRRDGDLLLSVTDSDITAVPLRITLKEAWYESSFLITGYHVCHEDEFNGEMALAHGTNDLHKKDFLYGARGVVMQGTGMASNGRYMRPTRVNSGWHRNQRGNRDYLDNPDGVAFAYTNSVQGAYGPVTRDHSIAVDPTVIPKRAQVEIELVGNRFADDTGSAIIGHHIDNFVGAGAAVQSAWERGTVNNTRRRVKYIGFNRN